MQFTQDLVCLCNHTFLHMPYYIYPVYFSLSANAKETTMTGNQLDLNHLWTQVQELSAILQANREQAQGLIRRADEIRVNLFPSLYTHTHTYITQITTERGKKSFFFSFSLGRKRQGGNVENREILGFGIRDSGFGIRDSGFGVRGSGVWGYGITCLLEKKLN